MSNMTEYKRQMARDRAKHTFRHYMSLLFERADLSVDSDNIVEWDGIVDDIITAAGGDN